MCFTIVTIVFMVVIISSIMITANPSKFTYTCWVFDSPKMGPIYWPLYQLVQIFLANRIPKDSSPLLWKNQMFLPPVRGKNWHKAFLLIEKYSVNKQNHRYNTPLCTYIFILGEAVWGGRFLAWKPQIPDIKMPSKGNWKSLNTGPRARFLGLLSLWLLRSLKNS